MNWKNIYTDLICAELGNHTGYVELFNPDDDPGQFRWEILEGSNLVTMGRCSSVEIAKEKVGHRLRLLES